MRLICLCVAKSTTAKPLRSLNCAKIHFVEPSGFAENAIGRMPASISTYHAGSSVVVSATLIVLPPIEPATTYFPSGVTYALWIVPFVGIVLTLVCVAVSITSTPPGAWAIPT